jgi:hypothetical protein
LYQSAWKLRAAPPETGSVPVTPAKFVGEGTEVVPSRFSDRSVGGSGPWFQTSTPAKLTAPPPWKKNPFGTT